MLWGTGTQSITPDTSNGVPIYQEKYVKARAYASVPPGDITATRSSVKASNFE